MGRRVHDFPIWVPKAHLWLLLSSPTTPYVVRSKEANKETDPLPKLRMNHDFVDLISACPESRPEWMELGGGGGAVCYAPSRLGKLVLRITGFPRVTQQCHQSQQQEDSHHRETRHLYLGFHHPWDRDLWKSWIKQVSQTEKILTRVETSFL